MENTDIHNKYQNGKIYKITDNAYTEQYIGSTVQPLASRMSRHRRNYEDYRNKKYSHVSVFDLFDKYALENCKIELIERYPCKDKEELRRREGYWIKLEECVNKVIAGRSDSEYYIDNKEKFQEYRKEHWLKNKDTLKDKHQKYYYDNHERLRKHQNEKVECKHCHAVRSRNSMFRHNNRYHPEVTK